MVRIGKFAIENPGAPYKWLNGMVCYNNRVVITPNSSLVQQLLQEFHGSPYGGHFGVFRTYKQLAQQLYWPSMHR